MGEDGPEDRVDGDLGREVGQTFSLVGLMALAVGSTLGLSLLAARVLG
jgi:hypothetical protein